MWDAASQANTSLSGADDLGGWDLPASEPERYAPGGVLGQGGMGTVYAARDTRLHRDVALKVASDAPGAAERLVQEAWIAGQLDHPCIVPVHDAGIDADGCPWVVMRLVRGVSLRAAMEAPEAHRDTLLRHVRDACRAAGHAHRTGVVHRDLKPANILIGEHGETQVVDWGLARPVDRDDAAWGAVPADLRARTREGAAVGTPAYMSPEQAAGDPVDARSDVWTLGVVLHEVLCGEPLFDGDSGASVLAQVLAGRIPPVRERCPAVSAALAAVADRALSRHPQDRYADGDALADAIDAALAAPPVPQGRQGAWAVLAGAAAVFLAGLWGG